MNPMRTLTAAAVLGLLAGPVHAQTATDDTANLPRQCLLALLDVRTEGTEVNIRITNTLLGFNAALLAIADEMVARLDRAAREGGKPPSMADLQQRRSELRAQSLAVGAESNRKVEELMARERAIMFGRC